PEPARKRASEPPRRPTWLARRPSRARSAPDFSWLATHALNHTAPPPRPSVARVPMRLVVIPLAVAFGLALLAATFLWHPPALVITPGHPIDVSRDLSVTGADIHPITGHYMLTPVDIR